MIARVRPPHAATLVLVLACNAGDDGDAETTGNATDGSVSTFEPSAGDPSAVSMTFTNSSDPTDASVTDPTDATITDPSDPTDATDPTDASASTGSPSDSGDVSSSTDPSIGEESSGVDPTAETDTDGGGECCEAQDGPGCGDATIEACVCASEPFCCDVQWDVVCTVQTVLLGCATCPGIGGDGDCCAAHGNPGCENDEIEQCVCDADYICCVESWDDICVGIAMDDCAAC